MDGFYEVSFGNSPVGKVQLVRQGLYCRIVCRCRLPGDLVCRLFVQTDKGRENLGVVVPEGDSFLLDKKIPVKRLGNGPLRFALSSGAGPLPGRFIPICPEEPFYYIERLKDAFLESEQGKVGIRIQETPEAV